MWFCFASVSCTLVEKCFVISSKSLIQKHILSKTDTLTQSECNRNPPAQRWIPQEIKGFSLFVIQASEVSTFDVDKPKNLGTNVTHDSPKSVMWKFTGNCSDNRKKCSLIDVTTSYHKSLHNIHYTCYNKLCLLISSGICCCTN